MKRLMRIARRNGIRGFTAEVLIGHKAVQAAIKKSNTRPHSRAGASVIIYELDFE